MLHAAFRSFKPFRQIDIEFVYIVEDMIVFELTQHGLTSCRTMFPADKRTLIIYPAFICLGQKTALTVKLKIPFAFFNENSGPFMSEIPSNILKFLFASWCIYLKSEISTTFRLTCSAWRHIHPPLSVLIVYTIAVKIKMLSVLFAFMALIAFLAFFKECHPRECKRGRNVRAGVEDSVPRPGIK